MTRPNLSGEGLDADAFRTAAWACLLGHAALTLYAVLTRGWAAGALLAAYLVVATGFVLARKRLPALFSLLFAVAALLNGGGWALNWWSDPPWYDTLVHFYTTFAVSLAAGLLLYHSVQVHFLSHRWAFMLAIASVGMALGGLWEIVEWSFGVKETRSNSLLDLTADGVGAVLAGFAAVAAARHPSLQPHEEHRAEPAPVVALRSRKAGGHR